MYAIATAVFVAVLALVSSLAVVVQATGPRPQCAGALSSSPLHSWSSEVMLLHVQKRITFRKSWNIFLSPVLTVLLTNRQGETCDTLGEKLAANQTAIQLMNPGISCKCP